LKIHGPGTGAQAFCLDLAIPFRIKEKSKTAPFTKTVKGCGTHSYLP